MSTPYKPDRPVTSDKIRLKIVQIFNEKYNGVFHTAMGTWRRKFRKGLPKSRSQLRGFIGYGAGGSPRGSHIFAAIAISNSDDSALLKVYLLDGKWSSEKEAEAAVKDEANRLAVLEVMFADD